MSKILLVLTSHSELGDTGDKTGYWLEEFAAPYYFFKDRGVDVTLASPKGGLPPVDPKSELPDFQTDATRRLASDPATMDILSKTVTLSSVNSSYFDAVFYSGGYGPMWDLANNQVSIDLIESFYNSDKPVASVCHAPAIFKNTKDSTGIPLVKGKKVTAYSNSEEEAVQFTEIVPFSVEDMLIANGGIYSKGEDWSSYAQEDGNLITGQNPASAELVANLLLKQLA
ncbi:MAG: type 1 glutamine amidotransferase domain-containing protein [Cytophagales bacterium]|nr:type 1 glutamine amidotransferase domain-containing protein [Cytophagales bacterium]